MLAILNSLNAHNLLIFQPILMKLVSKFMVYRALSDKRYFSLGLLSPLKENAQIPLPYVQDVYFSTLCLLVSSADKLLTFAKYFDPDQVR